MILFLLVGNLSVFAYPERPRPVGRYGHGKLIHGVNAHRIFNEHRDLVQAVSPAPFQFATVRLVETLLDISYWVSEKWGSHFRLMVGDISKKGGGPIAKHITHQMGLDVDIAYFPKKYVARGHRSDHWHNRFPQKYVDQGRVSSNFDLEKNYALIQYAINEYPVSHVFVDCAIKKAFMAYHPPQEDPQARKKLFKHLVAFPEHHDHFHLRLRCPVGSYECRNDQSWRDVGCQKIPSLKGRAFGQRIQKGKPVRYAHGR